MLEASSLGYHGAGKMADDALAQARPSGWNLEQGLPIPRKISKWCLNSYFSVSLMYAFNLSAE